MQYHIQTLVKHLFDKDSFEQVTVQELKQFTNDYPYAAVGQFLYAKKLKDSGSYNHYEQSEQASLYFHNALWLRWQLEQKEEAPALVAKSEEPAQQPGFRIVVQMPKSGPAVISSKPATQPEEKKEEPQQFEESTPPPPLVAKGLPTLPESAEEPVQPAAEHTNVPVTEGTGTEEEENSLQVNENGSLEEKAAAAAEQARETEAANAAEKASAVAIAENSQLVEETAPAEAPVNAVSITEEVLVPAAGAADNVVTVSGEATVNTEMDDIIPAIEAEGIDEEIDDIVPAVEDAPRVEEAVTEVTAQAPEAPADQSPLETEEAIAGVVTPEEQAVEQVTEPVAEAEQAAPFTAETEQPATEEPVVDNTTERAVPEVKPEEPVQPEQPVVQTAPAHFTPVSMEGSTAVDLGEPIFESYHTIDYFASQGIKLMQEDFKDKLGKQLKSFTDWLRSMKRIGPVDSSTSIDEVTNKSIQRIAEHSVEEKEVLTEAMAEVWAKQGHTDKAIRVYEKLSLLNPAKSPYFAGRIEQLKAL
jgi:hypothetical protein